MAKEESAGTWPEVCKKVVFGDGLYSDCRKKVPGFDGFRNGSFDSFASPEEESFDKKILKNAILPPTPEELAVRQMQGVDEGDDEELGFFEDLMSRPWLMYGGVALALYLIFFWRKQEVVGTESPKPLPPPAAKTP